MLIQRRHIMSFFGFYGACLAVQLVGGYFTTLSVQSWYPTLDKSPLTPPGAAFGIAWSILYFLMALAATRVHCVLGGLRNWPLRWWAVQLALGLLWCIVFFGQQAILPGLIVIAATTLATILAVIYFWRTDALAGLLITPLLLWLTLATHLNLYIYLHN